MVKHTIGVVLSTFNGEEFLEEQLSSIINQTITPDQIIIVDDCSHDRSTLIAKKWKDKYQDKIKIYNNILNNGYSKNFEKGISLCDTSFIALCDQDDIWLPEKIEKCIKALNENKNSMLCYHNADLIYENGKQIGIDLNYLNDTKYPIDINNAFNISINNFPISLIRGFTITFRSELKKYIFPFPGERFCSHDWWITTISFLCFNPIYIDEKLVQYRMHKNQSSGPLSFLKGTNYEVKKKITISRIIGNIKRETIRLLTIYKKKKNKNIDKKCRINDIVTAVERLKIFTVNCKEMSSGNKSVILNFLNDSLKKYNY